MRSSRRPLWFVALLASVALAVVPPWLDSRYTNIQVAIAVGLIGVCIGLLVEQLIRGEQANIEIRELVLTQARETVETLHVAAAVTGASHECKTFVNDAIARWVGTNQISEVPVFNQFRADKASEFLAYLSDISTGSITVSIDGPYSVRARSFDSVVRYRAVAMGPLAFWNGTFGQRYLETQRQGIANHGLVVDRVFVLEGDEGTVAERVCLAQVEAGVNCWAVQRDWVPDIHREHVVDQGVLTFRGGQRLLMQPLATRYRQRADRERLSLIAGEIKAAEFSIDILMRHAVKVDNSANWPL